jgi:hypothetical protein
MLLRSRGRLLPLSSAIPCCRPLSGFTNTRRRFLVPFLDKLAQAQTHRQQQQQQAEAM